MSIHLENKSIAFLPKIFNQQPTIVQWLWLITAFISFAVTFNQYQAHMDIYELIIFIGSAITLTIMGFRWPKLAYALFLIGCLSTLAIVLYDGNLQRANHLFFLTYFISSQSAIMWMNFLFVFATTTYLFGLIRSNDSVCHMASTFTWIAMIMGYVGLLVRWHESYLISPDIGHIPVSNLYEVFILFCLTTANIYLFYEQKTQTYRLGFFSLLVISFAVCFILWYTFDRGANNIQPLVPALNSYWMKIHVPANFIGYGAFAIAAMNSVAWLLLNRLEIKNSSSRWLNIFPAKDVIDNINYKAITLGFAFFTIATVLGALWAAEAWGGYWSWDPKETWALIVWLNYAAWLHFRISKGWNGKIMAIWSIVGLFITLFAFLGVNMFLSGLHSYGEL